MFERKPRTAHESGLLAAHFVAQCDASLQSASICTDRLLWAGRNRSPAQPAIHTGAFSPVGLHGTDGMPAQTCHTGLDPMAAIAVRLRIAPLGKSRLTFATAAAQHSAALQASLDKHRQSSHIERSSLMSATLAGIRLRNLRMTAENFAAIQTLSTALLMQLHKVHRSPASNAPTTAAIDRRLLWPLGISGDRPLLVVTTGLLQSLGLLRSLGQCMRA